MPISIQALREQKAEKLKAARELQSKETFTVDDQTAFDALLADANALESRIQGQMKLEGLTDPQQAESVAGFTNAGGHVEVAASIGNATAGELVATLFSHFDIDKTERFRLLSVQYLAFHDALRSSGISTQTEQEE